MMLTIFLIWALLFAACWRFFYFFGEGATNADD